MSELVNPSSPRRAFLLLGKAHDPNLGKAEACLERLGLSGRVCAGRRGEPLPKELFRWRGDFLLSYLSPWVVPEACLGSARVAALNFHPGPPEYPGIGCTNFALYEGATRFGVTCHHMARVPDTGPVVAVRRFSVYPDDTVWTLTLRCYEHILVLFDDVMTRSATGEIPASRESWTRRPFLRRELDALCLVSDEMTPEEIRRRVRAVTFPGMPGAYRLRDGRREEILP